MVVAAATAACLIAFGETDRAGALLAREQAVWDAVKAKDTKRFGEMLASDYRGVYDDGIETRATEITNTAAVELRSFTLQDAKVTFPVQDVAVVPYGVTTQAKTAQKDLSGLYRTSSVWVWRTNRWVLVLHTEVKAR